MKFSIKLYKDAKQVNETEFLRRGQRPPLNISANAESSWNEGGEVEFTFSRTNIETCDEIWLGLYDKDRLVEEWELLGVRSLPFASQYFDEDDCTTILYEFNHMRRRAAGKKWNNWSVL